VLPPLCEPGSNDIRCQQTEGNSEGSELLPDSLSQPQPARTIEGKDDFHGKGDDPRYHAFHTWQYQPVKPRRRNYGKRDVSRALLNYNSGAAEQLESNETPEKHIEDFGFLNNMFTVNVTSYLISGVIIITVIIAIIARNRSKQKHRTITAIPPLISK